MRIPLILMLAAAATHLPAQEATGGKMPAIQDNSFLLEEAYNQEAGVIQHISTWQRYKETKDWAYTFTQEWPMGSQSHQFSFTLPFLRTGALSDPRTGLGDVLLNYRYQLLGDGEARVAVSPRASLILPTGSSGKGHGSASTGLQVALPISLALTPSLAAHSNLGATWLPRAKNPDGEQADLLGWNLGQSLIWIAHPRFNVMLEYVYSKAQSVAGPGRTEWSGTAFLSPGMRWAYNFSSGLQIVPGIAVPIGVGPSAKEKAVFLYLSFEHPLKKVR